MLGWALKFGEVVSALSMAKSWMITPETELVN